MRLDRRGLLRRAAAAAATATLARRAGARRADELPNLLVVTADDLGKSSVGIHGCGVAGVTPRIDALARESFRLERAHVTVSACQPSRATWMTGLLPHRSGAVGFRPVREGVVTLPALLAESGYLTALFSKVHHFEPAASFPFERRMWTDDLGRGRDPERYRAAAAGLFAESAESGRPFFLLANTDDPHRPFPGSADEARANERAGSRSAFPEPPDPFAPDEIEVPAFLPDLPPVRAELAQYFTAVRRADATVGALLDGLDASGLAERTVVMFLSDNGMAFPFGKAACYRHSTATPWIVRGPGVAGGGRADDAHFASGVDLVPTALELLGLPVPDDLDGRSFAPLATDPEAALPGRERAFTSYDATSGGGVYPMRAVHDARHSYVFNAWADGTTTFRNETLSSETWAAMRTSSKRGVQARVEHYLHRTREELYDTDRDPGSLRNLATAPTYAETLASLRATLRAELERTADPLLAAFDEQVGDA